MSKKTKRTTLFPFLFFLTFTLLFSISSPQGTLSQEPVAVGTGDAIITLDTPTPSVDPSTEFEVHIKVQPTDVIAGVQCDLQYDPSLITLLNITEGELFTGYDTYFTDGTHDPVNGEITGIAGVIITPGGRTSAPGTFATLHFQSLKHPGTSSLSLSNVIIGDPTAVPFNITIYNTSITVEMKTTLVEIIPQSHTILPNETHDFSILVSPTTEIAGVQVTLTYDPTFIQITNISQGTLFGSTQYFYATDIDNINGVIDTISSVTTTLGGITSPGTLAHITFKSVQKRGTTQITLQNVLVGDTSGAPLSHTTRNATFDIGTDFTHVSILPSTQLITTGTTFPVEIHIDPTEPIAGAQFDLTFNPSLLAVNSIKPGTLFSGVDIYFTNGTIDNTNGLITGVAGSILGSTAITTPGTFATITFTAKSITGTSPLDLTNVIIGDIQAQPVPVTITNGVVEMFLQDTTVSVSPDIHYVSQEETFTLDILVDPVEAISGVEVSIDYDPDLLTIVSVTEGDLFSGFETYFNNGTMDTINGSIDSIWGVIAEVGGGSITSPGIFATLTFTAGNNTYGASPITLSHAIVGTPAGQPVPITLNHGTVVLGFSHTYPLYAGWNLLTLPIETTHTAETLGQTIDTCDAIVKWDTTLQDYVPHPVGTGIQNFPIEPGIGYFVHLSTDTTLTVPGIPLDDIMVPIKMGWNLAGWIHEDSITAEEFGETIPGCDVVAKWDTLRQDYEIHPVGTPIENFIIYQGDGLFIHTGQDSTWHGH